MSNNGKTIEQHDQEEAQRKTILTKPGNYVGSLQKTLQWFWVLNPSEDMFIFTELEFVPAL
jgi:hypothetical protein